MIFCFSGTGNSRYVAGSIAALTGDRVEDMAEWIAGAARKAFAIAAGEKIVWVFPVYSWGIPPVVIEFIRNVEVISDAGCRHYMVCTCGDDTGLTHRQWRREIVGRGWVPQAAFSVQMPNTYTLMKGFDVDSKEVESAKLDAVPKRVGEIVGKMSAGFAGDDVVSGSWAWVKSRIIYPWFVRYCMSPRPFHHDDACVGCGKCVRECPMRNIVPDGDSRPQWGNRCAMCLRCYHTCPHHAVAYGKATAGKGQYICPK